jgi:hypothetical protein
VRGQDWRLPFWVGAAYRSHIGYIATALQYRRSKASAADEQEDWTMRLALGNVLLSATAARGISPGARPGGVACRAKLRAAGFGRSIPHLTS